MTATAAQLRASIAEAEQAYDVERDHARTAARNGNRQQAARHDTAADHAGERIGLLDDQLAALQQRRTPEREPGMSAQVPHVAADGVALIAAERQRQIDQEGYTPEQDRAYNGDQLSRAAVAYLSHDTVGLPPAARSWPWSPESFKPSPREPHDGYWTAANIASRVRDLSKAGALVAAEIDRLQAVRAEPRL